MRARLPLQEGTVDRNGVGLHYEIYGDAPDTMVFVPPWSIVHSRVYKAQLPWFSERFRCITYDPRGNGKSGRPEEAAAYSLDSHVADLLAVMDATQAGKAILVGLSFGGHLSCIVAAHHPERVRAAIIAGTSAAVGPANAYMMPDHFRARRDTFEGWDKYNRDYWLANYPDFADHFVRHIFSEPHSTKHIEDGLGWAAETSGPVLALSVEARAIPPAFDVGKEMYKHIACPMLVVHGDQDRIQPHARGALVAELAKAEFVTIPGGGHNPLGRYPAKCNALIVDFLDRRLDIPSPLRPRRKSPRQKRVLYLSSPIGLGHGRRDIAVARELRRLHPGIDIDWLAQDPVTRLLKSAREPVHPASAWLVSESRHIEAEAGEHDLNAFQAIRRMDEILIANFMVFQEAVETGAYDLVVADEAWEIDHFWHEHPELKKAQLAWLTDFVGFVPMPSGGAREALLTADYNSEMLGHVGRHPEVRGRAVFVGRPQDIVPMSFGRDLPEMRDWIPKHYDFSGYILGEHPQSFGPREEVRRRLGYRADELVCIATVGGSGVGAPLLRRILRSWPMAARRMRGLRMIVVTGPRINPASLGAPQGVELRAFVPDLDRHLAACDLALMQGGLTTCMELAAAATPFLYFPLQNHFEQNVHVAHRLDQYSAGRRMDYATATPDSIAQAMIDALSSPVGSRAVETNGARRAASMLSELL